MNLPLRSLTDEPALLRLPATGLAPSLERKRLRLYLALMCADVILLLGSFYVARYVYFDARPLGLPLIAGQLLLPLYLTIALHNGTYSLSSLTDSRGASGRMAAALLLGAALLNFLAFFVRLNTFFSRVVFAFGIAGAFVLMVATRWLMNKWVRHHWGPTPLNVLQIDAGGGPLQIPHAYRIDAAEHGLEPVFDNPHMLDRLSRYFQNMDSVIVNCPNESRSAWARVLKSAGVQGEITSDFARELGVLSVVHRRDVSTLLVSTGQLGMRARTAKRLFELSLSIAALALLAPVFAVAAVLIKLEDGGPVLFRQRRLGQGNRFFSIYKLRTMRVESSDSDGARSTGRADERVTRIGRVLRRTSIDELPQLINVLKGGMSIVGPRPHALGSQAGDRLFWQIDERYWQRHALRPGITGLAQVRGFRGATEKEIDLSSRLQADLEYLAGWSILRDVRIVFATIGVLANERAY